MKHPDPSTFKRLNAVTPSKSTQAPKANLSSQASGSLPLWNYSIVSPLDGHTYTGSMVGRNPYFNGHRGTTVQTYVVPLVLTMPDGTVFNPATYDPCLGDSVVDLVNGSPVYTAIDWNLNGTDIGTTVYDDAFQRANFWKVIAPGNVGLPYHTQLGYNLLATQNLTVPSQYGYTFLDSCPYGVVDYSNWLIPTIENTLIPNLTNSGVISPTGVVVFVTDSVVTYLNGNENECCALGAHGIPSGSSQTYVWANYDSSGFWDPDVSILSDELGKWMDDPLVTNATPAFAWSSANSAGVAACESILEVGDPLTGTWIPTTMPNGNTYYPQELAFFSWFFDQSPSVGANGWFSFDDSLKSPNSTVCQGSGAQPSTNSFNKGHLAPALAR